MLTILISDGNTDELIALEVGTFRNDSDAAGALGIPELKEETAFNVSGGFVLKPLEKMWLHVLMDSSFKSTIVLFSVAASVLIRVPALVAAGCEQCAGVHERCTNPYTRR